jgi:hypothetical protein
MNLDEFGWITINLYAFMWINVIFFEVYMNLYIEIIFLESIW